MTRDVRICLKHTMRSNWPGGYPSDLVARTPSSEELMHMATRAGFKGKILKQARVLLPCMLERSAWKGKFILVQYTRARDPYDYFRYCQKMDAEHTTDNGWLQSVARLLIAWVAEQLEAAGHGKGFADHFYEQTVRRSVVRPQSSESWGESLLEYYEEEMRDGTPDTTISPATDTRSFPSPPRQNVQRARTLGNNEDLREYLRNGGASKRVRGRDDPRNLLSCSNPLLLKHVKAYLATDAGRHLLEACEIDLHSVTIDHVWPQSDGGPDHLLNYHLMPPRHNSAFNDLAESHPAKQAYVGKNQMACVKRLKMEGTHLPWHLIN